MKLFANKKLFKKMVILLIAIILVNALMPLHMVSADADEDFGGALFRPICQFIAGVGDLVLSGLQWIFIGDGDIKAAEIPNTDMGVYVIRYSPGIIFSNEVPGLDANFIKPSDKKEVGKLPGLREIRDDFNLEKDKTVLKDYGFDYDMLLNTGKSGGSDFLWVIQTGQDKVDLYYTWNNEETNKTYVLLSQKNDFNLWNMVGDLLLNGIFVATPLWFFANISQNIDRIETLLNQNNWILYEIDNTPELVGQYKESTAAQLQSTVSKWYKALRLVALVALLSVLVYVGIRIIISSTGQEKAKYKKMIGDWVAAICILFILNYIMAFTMDIIEKITGIFSTSGIINSQGADTLMSGIRNSINSNQYSGFTTFTYLILYLVLVVYTVIFTIHYLKRVVYLAFFTMIAPLIAVTYPIDKIKDGQAQAFGTWIKEYTFNAAIPIIHIIIYSVLVGSAMDLAKNNPLYAIVCISFLIPGEKIFRKLFGFEKATTAGQLGAAAGGALVMNAINKMGHKSGKQAAAKAGASSSGTTRGLSANAMQMASGAGEAGASGGGSPAGGTPTAGGTADGTGGAGGAGTTGGAGAGGTGTTIRKPRPIRQGLGAVRRRYLNKNTAKSAGRLARKVALGGAGALLAGSAGLAAGIATGDLSNAFKYGVAGAGAGFSGANYAGDKLLSGAKNVGGTFLEGAIGQEEYNNRKSDKEFYNSDEFKNMVNNYDLLSDEVGIGHDRTAAMRRAVQVYRDNGITDTQKISEAMQLGLSPREGAYAIRLAQNIGRSGWNNKNVREDYEKRYRANMPSGLRSDEIWNSIEDLL